MATRIPGEEIEIRQIGLTIDTIFANAGKAWDLARELLVDGLGLASLVVEHHQRRAQITVVPPSTTSSMPLT